MFELIGVVVQMVGEMGTAISNQVKTGRDIKKEREDLEAYISSDKNFMEYTPTEVEDYSYISNIVAFGFLILVIYLIYKIVKK